MPMEREQETYARPADELAAQAKADRKLETPISDLHGRATVLELLAEDCLSPRDRYWEKQIQERLGALKGYRIIVLTKHQPGALDSRSFTQRTSWTTSSRPTTAPSIPRRWRRERGDGHPLPDRSNPAAGSQNPAGPPL